MNEIEKLTVPISIIIPTLNEEKLLPRLLESIKVQEYQPLEVIVADSPLSTDRTAEIARRYGAKVVEGGRVAIARNNGAKVAKGDIVFFLDADATLPYDYFLAETYIHFMKNNLQVGSCFLDLDTTEKMEFVNSIAPHIAFTTWNQLKKLYAVTKKVFADSGTGIIAKKEVFDALGGFREEKEFIGEDTEFSKRAVESGFKYMVLPVRIITSGRRYDNPKKATSAFLSTILTSAIIGLGFYNSDRILKFVVNLYGELGGGTTKKGPKKK